MLSRTRHPWRSVEKGIMKVSKVFMIERMKGCVANYRNNIHFTYSFVQNEFVLMCLFVNYFELAYGQVSYYKTFFIDNQQVI